MEHFDIGILFPSLKRSFGAERLIVETADILAESANVILYVAAARPEASPKRAELVSLGLEYDGHTAQTLGDWAAAPLLSKKTRRHDVFLAMNYQGVLAGALAARRHRVPLVYHCTEPPRFLYDLRDLHKRRLPGAGFVEDLARKLDSWAVRQASEVIAISDWTAAQVEAVYGRTSTVIYPGINKEPLLAVSREASRAALGIPESCKLYVSLSKLHPRKRLTQAIDAFSLREMNNGSARLAIVGDGPDRGRLEEYARQLADPRISFEGYVDEVAKARWLRAADVFLFTARDEPFGLAPLEAKAAGAEVIPICPPYPIVSPSESTALVRDVLLKVVGRSGLAAGTVTT